MELFLTYLTVMFLFGLLSRRRSSSAASTDAAPTGTGRKTKFAVILGACLVLCIGYFFLNQI